jgi:hypothetical protein
MKRILGLFLILVMFLSGCGSSDFTETNGDVNGEIIDTNQKVEDKIEDSTKTTEESTKEESTKEELYIDIEQQVIVENEFVRITAKGIDYEGFTGPELKILIENLTDIDLTIQSEYSIINNIMIDNMFSADVAAGKKVNDGISFSETELSNYGIGEIAIIEVTIHAINSDSWDRVFETDVIALPTNVYESYVQEYYTEGFVMADEKGVKVTALGLGEDWMGPALFVAIENNSDQIITVQSEDVSVNGFMMSTIFSADVLPGKIAYDTVTFMSSDLEENEIEDITDMELKIKVINSDSWDRILETDIISLTF